MEHKILVDSKVCDVQNDDLASMTVIVIYKGNLRCLAPIVDSYTIYTGIVFICVSLVFSKLMLQADLEDDSFAIFLQILDKAIYHEVSTLYYICWKTAVIHNIMYTHKCLRLFSGIFRRTKAAIYELEGTGRTVRTS